MAAYLITLKDGTKRLVEARTGASALNHVLSGEAQVKTLKTSDVFALLREGLAVETVADKAKKEEAEATTEPASEESKEDSEEEEEEPQGRIARGFMKRG